MPMPRIRLKIIVSTSARKMLSLPMEIIQVPTMVPSPVSVMVPMTMPTTAQARPTGRPGARRPPWPRRRPEASRVRGRRRRSRATRAATTRHDERHARGERIGRRPGQARPRRRRAAPAPKPGDDGGAEDERDRQRQAHRAGEERRVAGEEQVDEHARAAAIRYQFVFSLGPARSAVRLAAGP